MLLQVDCLAGCWNPPHLLLDLSAMDNK